MIEPLTDQEFQEHKDKVVFETSYTGLVTQEDYDRLIATVDKWMEEALIYQSKAVRSMERVLEYKEENAKFKKALDAALKRIEEMEVK